MTTSRGRLAAAESMVGPSELVLGWLATATRFESLDAYSRACLRLQPPLVPLEWIGDQLIERRRRGQGRSARVAQLDDELRDARFLYEVALDLLADGEAWWREWYPLAQWLTLALSQRLSRRAPAWEREALVAEMAIARERALAVLGAFDCRTRTRHTMEAQYFEGRNVRFAQASDGARRMETLMAGLQLALAQSPGDAPAPEPRRATDAEVEAAVYARISLAHAVVAGAEEGPAAMIRPLRELLLDPDEVEELSWP